MSERPLENSLSALTEEDIAQLQDDELVHRMLEIAERGIVDIRTNVPLPPDVWGEWVSNTPEDIAAAQMKGFKIDDKYAVMHRTHSDGKGSPVVGDVIFMTCSRRIKDALDKAQQILFSRTHGTRKNLQEERDFSGNVKSAGLDINYKGNPINTSIQEPVTAGQIASTLKGAE